MVKELQPGRMPSGGRFPGSAKELAPPSATNTKGRPMTVSHVDAPFSKLQGVSDLQRSIFILTAHSSRSTLRECAHSWLQPEPVPLLPYLALLVLFLFGLALDAERRDRPGLKPLEADLAAAGLAYAI